MAKPPDPRGAEAKQHYDSGLAAFNLQDYDNAVREFEAAYRLLPDPVFLYNLAQSHRLATRHERALYFYRAYLRTSSDPPNRDEVLGRIETLEKLIAEQANAQKPPDGTLPPEAQQPAPAPATAVAAPSPPERKRKPVYRQWWLWTIVGVVAAGAAVGLGVGLSQPRAGFDASVGTFGPSALGGPGAPGGGL